MLWIIEIILLLILWMLGLAFYKQAICETKTPTDELA